MLSPVVVGAWRLASWGWHTAQVRQWIDDCLALGVSSFDHADIYGGYTVETQFGAALAEAPGLRDRLQLISKCGIKLVSPARPHHRLKSYDTSAAHLMASVEQSLAALHTDRLDLLLIHRPDVLMDVDEVAATFERLRREGKVLHFGVSNFLPWQVELLNRAVPVETQQVECHPLHPEPMLNGVFGLAQRLQHRPMVWSPLAGGRLLQPDGERSQAVHAVLIEQAQRHGVSPALLAYAWVMRHPSKPLVVVGSRRAQALAEALAATRFEMDRETWYALLEAGQGRPVA